MTNTIESQSFWQQHIEKLKASGLPRTQYCRDNELNYDRFGYWLNKLTQESCFIPVKLKLPENKLTQPTLYTVELRNCVIKIHDISTLSFVLNRLA